MDFLTSFYSFMTALIVSLIMVPFLRQWALDRGDLDQPDERKHHTTAMPRLGGIAIFLAFLFSAIVFVPIDHIVRGILAGALIMFAIGVVDDLNGLSSKRKFAGQIAACLATIIIGKIHLVNVGNLFGAGDILLPPWIGIPFTVFAVVGVTNAINLIDGLDGLAGGISVIALAAFTLLGTLDDDPILVILSASLAGGVLGFLKYNFYPARIFMGDTGSLVVGFLLGFMAVAASQVPGSRIGPMVPVVILGLPLLDTVWVMLSRVRKGQNPFVADRTHVHHKFLSLGFQHRFTVVIIYGISLFWACFAIVFRKWPEYGLLFFYLSTAISAYMFLRYILQNREKYPFLGRDATAAIRSTATFSRICGCTDRLIVIVFPLLGAYLLSGVWGVYVKGGDVPWQITMTLLVVGVYLRYKPLAEDRQFLLLVIYAAFGIVAFAVWSANDIFVGSLSLKRVGDILLGFIGVVTVLKIVFRHNEEWFLSTADYLVLAVIAFLAIASQQEVFGFNLHGPLFRSTIAILAVRSIVTAGPKWRDAIICSGLGFLCLVTVIGLIA